MVWLIFVLFLGGVALDSGVVDVVKDGGNASDALEQLKKGESKYIAPAE